MKEDEQPEQCSHCQKYPENILMLGCRHDLCLECAARIFDSKQNQYAKDNNGIQCSLCKKITQLDQSSIYELEKIVIQQKIEETDIMDQENSKIQDSYKIGSYNNRNNEFKRPLDVDDGVKRLDRNLDTSYRKPDTNVRLRQDERLSNSFKYSNHNLNKNTLNNNSNTFNNNNNTFNNNNILNNNNQQQNMSGFSSFGRKNNSQRNSFIDKREDKNYQNYQISMRSDQMGNRKNNGYNNSEYCNEHPDELINYFCFDCQGACICPECIIHGVNIILNRY